MTVLEVRSVGKLRQGLGLRVGHLVEVGVGRWKGPDLPRVSTHRDRHYVGSARWYLSVTLPLGLHAYVEVC